MLLNINLKLIVFSLAFLYPGNVFPQNITATPRTGDEPGKEKEPKKGDISLLATPIIGYNPTYGLKFGAGASAGFFAGDPSTTSISSILTGINFTTKKQVIFTMQSSIYTRHNDLILNGDWDYIDGSKPTYGLGTGPSSSILASNNARVDDHLFQQPIDNSQLLVFRHIRFYETVAKSLKENLFIGIGYHLDIFDNIEDRMLDTTSENQVITSYHAYTKKYGFDQGENTLSGISLNVTWDSRDNQNNPYSGQFANLAYHINPVFLGSDRGSSSLWIEYRTYLDLSKNHYNMLCIWGIGNFTISGALPYTDLPATGEDLYGRTGRGYTEGRFRGQSMVYLETEYRRRLFGIRKNPDFMRLILFANAVTASNRDAGTNLFRYFNFAAGAGLRAMIKKTSRTSLGLDYGLGNYGSSGFYLVVNETF